MKKKLKPGQRVRVYAFWFVGGYIGKKGTVKNMDGIGCRVKLDSGGEASAHPRQCVRLKKKPKPERERIERVECYLAISDDGWWSAYKSEESAKNCAQGCVPPIRVAHMVEIREGEQIIDHTTLARAFGLAFTMQGNTHKDMDPVLFEALAKALGLSTKGEGA